MLPNDKTVATEKVLRVSWNPVGDKFYFKVKLNFTERKKLCTELDIKSHQLQEKISQVLTKCVIQSQVNNIYDPLGLAGPFTVWAKIVMRQLWTREVKIDWDDPLPEEHKRDWIKFFWDHFSMNNIKFERCLKPPKYHRGPQPCNLQRWITQRLWCLHLCEMRASQRRRFGCSLILSKNHLAPIKRTGSTCVERC